MGQALAAVQSRFHNLGTKLDSAWEKISGQLDDLLDDSSLAPAAWDAIQAMQDRFEAQQAAMAQRLESEHNRLETEKHAVWARQLRKLAAKERQESVNCVQCGGELPVPIWWRASSETCTYCGAVNELTPGTATAYFFSGIGVHALAHEGALTEWESARVTEDQYKALRHPAEEDRAQYLHAERTYWETYYEIVSRLNPGFEGSIEDAAQAKMKHHDTYDTGRDRQDRAFFQQLVACGEDAAALRALITASTPDLDDCAMALVERGKMAASTIVLEIQHVEDEEDEPLDAWVRERLQELRGQLR